MRHENNKRDLPHKSAFTGHVGACDNHSSVFVRIETGVVGHKYVVFQKLFHNGVAPLRNFKLGSVRIQFGLSIIVCNSRAREACKSVEFGYRLRYGLKFRYMRKKLLSEFFKQLLFKPQNAFVGIQNLFFELFQFFRNKSFARGNSLFADITLRQHVLEGIGNLYVITEYAIVAHFQGFYACFRSFSFFELAD